MTIYMENLSCNMFWKYYMSSLHIFTTTLVSFSSSIVFINEMNFHSSPNSNCIQNSDTLKTTSLLWKANNKVTTMDFSYQADLNKITRDIVSSPYISFYLLVNILHIEYVQYTTYSINTLIFTCTMYGSIYKWLKFSNSTH